MPTSNNLRVSLKLLFTISILFSLFFSGSNKHDQFSASEEDMQWWIKARFGVFIHWGPNSILELAHGGWRRENIHEGKKGELFYSETIPDYITDSGFFKHKRGFNVPVEVYDNLPHIFNPSGFDADEYVRMVKNAGAKYIVFTAKHMDNFSMFDTKYSDYNIMNTPYGKDICKQLADACHKHDIKLIWYYCIWDIANPLYDQDHPQAYSEFMNNQVRELCTNYGKIYGFWFDAGGRIPVDREKILTTIKTLQPHAITNGRMKFHDGDFITPEQRIGTFNMDKPWESCQVMQVEGWFWAGDQEIKSKKVCTRMLIDCAGGDGNLLLDFGPRPDGRINPPFKARYAEIGQWLKKYGETIYETRGGPYKPGPWGVSTRKGQYIYIHITQKWPNGTLTLPDLGVPILSYSILTGGEAEVVQNNENLIIKIKEEHHDPISTIIKIKIQGNALDIKPIETFSNIPVSLNKYVSASSELNKKQTASTVLDYDMTNVKRIYEEGEDVEAERQTDKHQIIKNTREEVSPHLEKIYKSNWVGKHRGHRHRYWSPKEGDTQPWIEIDFGKLTTFNYTSFREKESRIRKFKLQYWDNKWVDYYKGDVLDVFMLKHDPVEAQKVRLLIEETDVGLPRILTFDLFYEPMNN